MIGRREGYDFDVELVASRRGGDGTFLEINCQPHRLDLRPSHARAGARRRRPLVISTDAHNPGSFRRLALGAAMARRAWATRDDVLNARDWAGVEAIRAMYGAAGAR